jgi:RNA polymerase-binding transcription factor DksA
MQVTIEQHDAVLNGLATELAIRQEQLSHMQEELKLAREDFNEVEEDRNLLSKQLTNQATSYQRMLERIRQVAVGDYPPCTQAGEPEWSVALTEVEVLWAQSETARAATHLLGLGLKAGVCGQCGGPVIPRKRKRK